MAMNPERSPDSPFGHQPSFELTPRNSDHLLGSTARFSGYASSTQVLQPYQGDAEKNSYSAAAIPSSPGPGAAQFVLPQSNRSRRKKILLSIVASLVVLAAAIVCIYLFVIRPKKSSNDSASANSGGDHGTTAQPTGTATAPLPTPSNTQPITGGDRSTVTMEDGTTFVYRNSFGGFWVEDPNDPFNDGARPQSWSPALNETFRYGVDLIRGVNLGGWLNTEPFISPALYQKYATTSPRVRDEWALSLAMRADTAGGGINQLEEHYKTFITEKDFAEIAAAGLNYVRIPLGYWAIDTWEGEPFLAKVSWRYFLKAIRWARKYGLRINLDLHAVPGSQNGWNHSGRLGTAGWLHGTMGYANAQRSLDYIRILAQFISQPQYKNVVTMFGIINEPVSSISGADNLRSFYAEAYKIIRDVGGIGEGNGPWVSIYDGLEPLSAWAGFMSGADRIALDSHTYRIFSRPNSGSMASQARAPCDIWTSSFRQSTRAFGLTNSGEWSNAATDCALFLNGVGAGTRYEGTHSSLPASTRVGSCRPWIEYETWDAGMKKSIMDYALASMDAFRNSFFWTWNIGPSLESGKVEAPDWSYKLGLENGWMPKDPRTAIGFCEADTPSPPLPAWHTGGAGAGQLASTIAWPPPAFVNSPAYTPTGVITPLPAQTFTITSAGSVTTADAGNGWAKAADQTGIAVPVAGCQYLDPWADPDTPAPAPCGIARRDSPPEPLIAGAPTPSHSL